ncbi:ribose-phosphate pyrophosphokinase [bacterium]|nr:ribose-phosphate pyrophosphokinase [bacterium]
MDRLKILPVNYPDLAYSVAKRLEVEVVQPEICTYPNGCLEVKLPREVRDCSAFVFLTSIPGETLPRDILITQLTLAAAYESFASKVVLVMPYFSYARSDKKEGRMGIAAKIIAKNFLIACDGHTPTIVFDLHAPQVEGFFERIDNFSTFKLLIPYLRKKHLNPKETIVLPDDTHSIKRALLVGEHLGFPVGYVEKMRISSTEVKILSIQGDYQGKTAIIAADEICTGGTIATLIQKIENEIKEAIIVAAHGVFVGNALSNLSHPLIKEIIVSNTLPIPREIQERLPITIIDIAPFLSSILQAIHKSKPLSPLFEIK